MADMGTKEASEKWGYTQETIRIWCANGLIANATQDKKRLSVAYTEGRRMS